MVRSKIASISTAFFLLGILALPNISQWIHLIEEHHTEQHCIENKVHLHATELPCELNATFVSPYTPADVLKPKFHKEFTYKPKRFKLFPGYNFNQVYSFHLRGPPQLLFSV